MMPEVSMHASKTHANVMRRCALIGVQKTKILESENTIISVNFDLPCISGHS